MKSSPNTARRFILTAAILSAAAGIAAIVVIGQSRERALPGAAPASADAASAATASANAAPASPASTDAGSATSASAPAAAERAPAPQPPAAGSSAPREVRGWVAAAPGSPSTTATAIGSVDPAQARFLVELTPRGAGISRIVFSDIWRTAADAAAARAGRPDDDARYRLEQPGTLQGYDVPMLAVYAVEIDGCNVSLDGEVWRETAPGTFVTEVSDSTGALQMRITRRWSVTGGADDIRCEQRVENLSGSPRSVCWHQYGPSELARDANDSVDSRRFMTGYLMAPARDPAQSTVIVHDGTVDQATIVKEIGTAPWLPVWPGERQRSEGHRLSWFGATNRYFALALHAPYDPPTAESKAIAPAVAAVDAYLGTKAGPGATVPAVFTTCTSDTVKVAPGATAAFDVGVFAGPLERSLLAGQQPFAALNMQGLILYLMSGCCSWCTFSWLADSMVWFLAFLHDNVVFDWGLAIIVLVIVVRGILHPLTRRSQISMMRVGKQMAAVKPELDALQRRYKDEPKRLQEETIRLYRERGINPLGFVGGMLPTFLQMPIWIALYAVLYFAFELRQQPAFFGVFQSMGGWGFLGDLSAQDRFVVLPFTVNLYLFELGSVNLVPILMGFVFFLQQKYMAPPPAANLSPEAESQQKMMKWMMIILFPLMLYTAPSGLTLYIATSTLVGIYESKRVRREVDGMDLTKPAKAGGGWLARALERAQEAQRRAQERPKAPSRKFRDR